MKVIGFASKFYTLWEVTEDERDLGNGCKYVITRFCYIKNISYSKEEAMKKYPDTPIDESLRGKTVSFNVEKEVWDNVDVFRFGKYKYEKINESTDTDYIAWYWDNVYDETHKEFVTETLKNRGYEIRESRWTDYDGHEHNNVYLVSPETLETERKNAEALNNMIEKVKNSDILELTMTSNLDEDGYYREGDVLYKFAEVKENYYQGWSYYLPVLKGKAKRVKNKTIVITKFNYSVEGSVLNINIEDFKIA